MNITYTGQLASLTGSADEALDLPPGTTLGSLVDQLIARHGDAFANMLRDDGGTLRSTLLVVTDGKQATGDREALPLDGVTELMFMTPIAGG